MYNTERLTQWKKETEEILQKIIDERRKILHTITDEEIPKKYKVFECNGSVTLQDKKLETVYPTESEEFINELTNMQYNYLELCIAPVASPTRSVK
jgi:hypothetical protein